MENKAEINMLRTLVPLPQNPESKFVHISEWTIAKIQQNSRQKKPAKPVSGQTL